MRSGESIPPEAALIRRLRTAMTPKLSIRAAAADVGISEARWRQVESGYQTVRAGVQEPVIAPAETLARMANGVDATPDQLRDVGRADAAEVLDGFLTNVDKFTTLAKRSREQSVHPMLNEGVQLQTIAETMSRMIDALNAADISQALVLEAADTLSTGESDGPGLRGITRPETDALHRAAAEASAGRRDLIEYLRGQVVKLIATANPSNAEEVVQIFTPMLDRIEQVRAFEGGNGGQSIDEPQSPEPNVADRMRSQAAGPHTVEGRGD
ncbi:helix-turn-helix transcriptional regulator [Mycobacteroides abscessus]|uniref:helix-turn-helix transcriptional regulator n=1 Tax=Mycobacteroides abscessus TaxID=36809 RepID=UPI00189698CF